MYRPVDANVTVTAAAAATTAPTAAAVGSALEGFL